MIGFVVPFVFSILVYIGSCANSCTGKPNMLPINENDYVFVSQNTNAKLYTTKNIDPPISIVHLYGTPYQMGLAQGQILKPYISNLVPAVMSFLEAQIGQAINFLPQWLRDVIEVEGLDAALELTYYATRDYTPSYFYDELKGLSDGTGIDYQTLINIHMFPELIQAACSMVGAWGDAIKNTTGSLYQLRALDWTTNGPFQQFPALLVYHPNPGNGNSYSILTFAGFIGALTGFSSSPVGICEKVWISYNGTENRFGYPWHFLLRDILQFDHDITSGLNRIINAQRTCSIHVGLGDPVNKFRVVEYSYDYVTIYNDQNYPVYPAHPRMEDLLYVNKHVQPSNDPCLGQLLEQQYGAIDPAYLIQHVTAEHQTGDTHAAVYDFKQNVIYVVIASPWINGSYTPAYDRQWTKFDMTALFNEKL